MAPDSWPRRRLLALVRNADVPLDAHQLARETGQHVTTVRFHLDVLTKESLIRQVQQPPRGRGRPRIGYTAVQRSVGYQDLAQVLADRLGSNPGGRLDASVAAGRAWAAKLDENEEPVESLSEAHELTTTLSAKLGFAPESSKDADDSVAINFTACPLRDLARTHSEVVCGVHLGMLREVLDRAGASGTVTASLHPFVGPELCVARLTKAEVAVPAQSERRGA